MHCSLKERIVIYFGTCRVFLWNSLCSYFYVLFIYIFTQNMLELLEEMPNGVPPEKVRYVTDPHPTSMPLKCSSELKHTEKA